MSEKLTKDESWINHAYLSFTKQQLQVLYNRNNHIKIAMVPAFWGCKINGQQVVDDFIRLLSIATTKDLFFST